MTDGRAKPRTEKQLAQLAAARARVSSGSRTKQADAMRRHHAANPEHLAALLRASRSCDAQRKRTASLKRPFAERYGSKITITETCWTWSGSTDSKGYPQMRHEGRLRFVSHLSLIASGREREHGRLVARHKCDNPGCVNPEHLEWGSQADNVCDMHERGRANLSGLALGRGSRAAA